MLANRTGTDASFKVGRIFEWRLIVRYHKKCEFTTALYVYHNPLFPHIIVEILVKSIWRWKCAVLGWNRKSVFLFLTSFHPTKTFKCPKP